MKISICIPAYEYNGKGMDVLIFSFKQLLCQSFRDFEIVVSDHSVDSHIEDACAKWDKCLDIKYFRNEIDRGSGSSNFNNGIKNCSGEIIKFLCCDDFVFGEDSLQIIVDNFYNDTNFLATGYYHTQDRKNYYSPHYPKMNDNIKIVNTIGTPSCVAVRKFKDMPEFDKNLHYCFDEEFYYQYIKKYNGVTLINDITAANYIWNESISSSISQETIEKENLYILRKHEYKNS